MKKMPLFMVLTFLAVFLSNSFAREPIELPPNISAAKLQGSGRLTWFGLHVYDAAFYRVGSLSSPDFALNFPFLIHVLRESRPFVHGLPDLSRAGSLSSRLCGLGLGPCLTLSSIRVQVSGSSSSPSMAQSRPRFRQAPNVFWKLTSRTGSSCERATSTLARTTIA